MENEGNSPRSFGPTLLPWIIAGAGLAVYLVTLNPWVSWSSLNPVAAVSGWTWRPELSGPLYWLITAPFRWLPVRSIPFVLNVLSALFAALALGQLARSVALLPHDRTHEQRQREKGEYGLLSVSTAWLPPVLAAVVCGLQLTFWENATAASVEMLNLLLFSFLIRCLLEFRISQREAWLTRFSFVCGAAMTNDWAIIGFFPLFLAAMIWIRGLEFFNVRFLVKMFICGLAGLAFYLLLPIVQTNSEFHLPFWAALKNNIGTQKGILGLAFQFLKISKQDAVVLALTSFIPVLLVSIRWASYFGDTSRMGVALTTFVFHIVHGVFLVICIWVALDPPFSPRFSTLYTDYGFPFLSISYLAALSVGYFCGYFLLLFSRPDRPRRAPESGSLVNVVISGMLWALALLTPVALVYRNIPQVRGSNGASLKQFGSLMEQSLPAEGAVVYSDDSMRLLVLQAALSKAGRAQDFALVETAPLRFPEYHRFLKKQFPKRWTTTVPEERKQPLEDLELLQLASFISKSNQLYYLHPSFGYYFELFYSEPHGLAYNLQMYSTNTIFPPPVSKELVAENEIFWSKANGEGLQALVRQITPRQAREPGFADRCLELALLKPIPNRDAALQGMLYSRALNYWGVEMQKLRNYPEAAKHFELAQELNPNNVVARLNLECNRNLQVGAPAIVKMSRSVSDAFGQYRGWEQVLNANGPFDEPAFCYDMGRQLWKGQDYRQAAIQFLRATELAPDFLAAHLSLAELYVVARQPEPALKLIEEIHARPSFQGILATNRNELLAVQVSAHLLNKDVVGAQNAVNRALAKKPDHAELLAVATQVYMAYSSFSNAVDLIDRQLKLAPESTELLINKGYACIGMEAFDDAIPPLTRALTIETNNYLAMLNRAIAYLRGNKLVLAKQDYERLQKLNPTDYRVFYGLGEIAYRNKDTNAAARSYELYLTNSPPHTEEAKFVRTRLKELQPGLQ